MLRSVPLLLSAFALAAILTAVGSTSSKSFKSEGIASYYARSFDGRKTANGEIFRNHDFTAAHRTLPFGTFVRVYNEKNHLSTTVRINDRGPFLNSRIIDLSEASARKIGIYKKGLAPVRLEILNLIKRTKTIDSLFSCEDILDCLGNPESMNGYSISLYKSKDLVHIIYLANELFIQEPVDKVLIAGMGLGNQRIFHMVLTNFKSRTEALEAVEDFERKGFMNVRLFPANE